jgi:isocitrate dehydrogenase (NAD+)
VRYTITELLGDGISQELSVAVREIAGRLPLQLDFEQVDLSLENRERRGVPLYDEAVDALNRNRFALKYPTATRRESPNAILRERCQFAVIHRPVASIPGVPSNFRRELNLNIVRVATGGTYDDPGRMIGTEAAVSLRIVERLPCWQAARYAFALARRLGCSMTSASKHTIQAATDGLFESIVLQVSADFPDVPRQEELFDALLAKIVMHPERFRVVLVLNEYGDFLSDMACGLAGSIGIGASANLAFAPNGDVRLAMFDPVGGTAPDIAGRNLVNPTGIFLALAMLLDEIREPEAARAVERATHELLGRGLTTRDLGGNLSTTEFTQAVADEVEQWLPAALS